MGKNKQKRTQVQSTCSQEGDVCVSCKESANGEAIECQWNANWQHTV